MGNPNFQPRLTKNGVISGCTPTAQNASSEGDGTIGGGSPTMFVCFTADPANGSFVDRVRIMPTATAPTTMFATVARFYASSVLVGPTLATNTFLLQEVTLPAANADSASVAVLPIDVVLGLSLPANWTLLVSITMANQTATLWHFTAFGGDY